MINARVFVEGFAIASLAFLGSLAVMFLYSFLVEGIGMIDWEWCLRYSLILGVVLPWFRWVRKTVAKS